MKPHRSLGFLLLILFSLLCGPPCAWMARSTAEAAPSLSVTLNQPSFKAGETLRVGLMAQNPGSVVMADFYLGILLPDGVTVFFFTSLSPLDGVVSRLDASPQTFKALLTNISIPQGMDATLNDVFVYIFSGKEPLGTFHVFTALAAPGSLSDGRSDPGDILTLDTKAFSFSATGPRLLQVSGNNQVVRPGEVLPDPLVVRLEDQFGNPIVGEPIRAAVIQGEGELLPPTSPTVSPMRVRAQAVASTASAPMTVLTDAEGRAAFQLRLGFTAGTVTVEVAAPNRPEVSPVEFLAIVGLIEPLAIAVEADGKLVVVDGVFGVVRVDPINGVSHTVSGTGIGRGPLFKSPRAIAVEADGQLVVVGGSCFFSLCSGQQVVRVDPRTGDRTILSDASTGHGPPFASTHGVAVEADGQLVVVDRARGAVVRVNPVTGDRTIVSDGSTGRGPPLVLPVAMGVEANGQLVVVDTALQAVVRVDPRTGNRTVVTGCTNFDLTTFQCTASRGGARPLETSCASATANKV
ncbi:MAG: hypothetical protein HYZ81_20755 [Nitrospinae bacterium]|nr:hypothetical protein [Nitrospinota bacterium]